MKKVKLMMAFLLITSMLYAQTDSDIFQACRSGNLELLQKLCAEDVSLVNETNQMGFSPLILAVYNDQPTVVKYLIEKKANLDAQDRSGNTALMGAIFKGYSHQVELLLKAGADVNLSNHNNAKALTFAATFGGAEITALLLEAGAEVDYVDSQGKKPLDHAIMQDNQAFLTVYKKYHKIEN